MRVAATGGGSSRHDPEDPRSYFATGKLGFPNSRRKTAAPHDGAQSCGSAPGLPEQPANIRVTRRRRALPNPSPDAASKEVLDPGSFHISRTDLT
jgi:hypothetical protein